MKNDMGHPSDAKDVELYLARGLDMIGKSEGKLSPAEAVARLVENAPLKHESAVVDMLHQVGRVVDITDNLYPFTTTSTTFAENASRYNMARSEKTREVTDLKTDVAFTAKESKYRLSVKLDGQIVLFSAVNADNFNTTIDSALELYMLDYPNDKSVLEFKELMQSISKEWIGRRFNRVVDVTKNKYSLEFFINRVEKNLKKLKERKYSNPSITADVMRNTVTTVYNEILQEILLHSDNYVDDYTEFMEGEGRKTAVQSLNEAFNSNEKLKRYVVFEFATAQGAFGRDHDAAANWILTPSTMKDMFSPESEAINHFANSIQFDLRGLPTDRSNFFHRVYTAIEKNDLQSILKDGMSINLKIDIRNAAITA